MNKEFTRRLKAELNQTEHLNIYEVPCPSCGASFVSSSRVRDDNKALSYCSAGHEFTRAQAFEAYNASVRQSHKMRINASARLLASLRASVVEAYDRTWINRMNQHRQAHPKYQDQQKPSQLVDEHIFTLEPSALAQRLKFIYKDDFRAQ